ncbi:MAG: AAA domain protein [Caudoviricetes sp.]|nr:MAG: AAA domain protein [Caudoviricetes sp.]
MAILDIFNAPKSVIADGLEGKVILIYGSNNLGKSYQATRLKKPFVMACELGLNGIDGIPYAPIVRWSDFKTIINQFTGPKKQQAKELYSTIIVDEVYASSIYCQDYVCSTYGDGALTMADGDSKHNLYQLYEKEYFRQINLLTSSGYTVVFIAHEQANSKTGFITPKGDKRCINPIIDKCDYVIYLKSNGVDAEGRVIKSSGFLAQTSEFFARAKIEYTPTFIKEFTAENLVKTIQTGIDLKRENDGSTVTSFAEQQKMNMVDPLNFEKIKKEFQILIESIPGYDDYELTTEEGIKFQNFWNPKISHIVESHLGKGGKVSQCNVNQVEALDLIVKDLKILIEENKVEEQDKKEHSE